MDGLISHIQRYSTKDGPGLRTTVFTVGCNLRCLWCANPEGMLPGIKVMIDPKKCVGCGCCVAAAMPCGSITLGAQGRAVVDRARCENLPQMVEECPYEVYEAKGYAISAQALAEKLLRDKAFYQNSGGGVTFSGGEPLLQAGFVLETTRILKGNGVHVALDTAGLWDFEAVRPLLELADLVLFDVKAYDPALHRRCTGVPNQQILQNGKRLAKMGKPMLVRLVVVPTLNDDPADIAARLDYIQSLGESVRQVDILKYHRLGEGKYLRLGMEYPLPDVPSCDDATIEAICEMALARGLAVTVDG